MKRPVFFLHIPKTAGTSFHALLTDLFKETPTAQHVELHRAWQFPEFWRQYAFISGHLKYFAVRDMIPPSFVVVTLLRDPWPLFVSNFQYLCSVAAPETRHHFDYVSDELRAFCAAMADADLNDPKAFESWLTTTLRESPLAPRLLDNVQARYLARIGETDRFGPAHEQQALEAIQQIPVVGLVERLDESLYLFFEVWGGTAPPGGLPHRLNTAFVRLPKLDRPEIREICEPLIRYDRSLYRLADRLLTDRVNYLRTSRS